MRKPLPVKSAQQGFSLMITTVMLLVIALIVVAGTQLVQTDMRLSANDADRQAAMTLAEAALLHGEQAAVDWLPTVESSPGSDACTDGFCTPALPGSTGTAATPAWQRSNVLTGNSSDPSTVYTSGTNETYRQPRYIIENLGRDINSAYKFRVTARAWGRNPNTVVTVQSIIYANP